MRSLWLFFCPPFLCLHSLSASFVPLRLYSPLFAFSPFIHSSALIRLPTFVLLVRVAFVIIRAIRVLDLCRAWICVLCVPCGYLSALVCLNFVCLDPVSASFAVSLRLLFLRLPLFLPGAVE